MKPADALRLPRARVTAEQRVEIAKGIAAIEDLYPQAMARGGITITMTIGDPVVMSELQRHCAGEGWIVAVQPNWQPPRVHGGQPRLAGVVMILTPPPAAYAEVDAEQVQ